MKLLRLFIYIGLVQLASGEVIKLQFDPPELVIKVYDTVPINFNVTIAAEGTGLKKLDVFPLGNLEIESVDPGVASLSNITSIDLNLRNVLVEQTVFQFFVSGEFTGRTTIKIRSPKLEKIGEGVIANYSVVVLRLDTMATLSRVFTITMFTLIVINTFVMGLQLDWRTILEVFKRPVAPAIGFACQYIIMPLVATAWAFALLNGAPYLQFGYFAVGCAPGGGNSNFWTLLLHGNLDLSVTMTFCSNIAALAMMPFWLYTLGRLFFSQAGGEHMAIPFSNIVVSLVCLIGPVFAGIVLAHFRPEVVKKSKKVIKITTLIVIAVAAVFGSISNAYVFFLITWREILCGLLLPWIGFALSYAIAFFIGQDHRNCRTIAIETGIQNAGIAIVLLQTSLAPPESDLAMVMPVCVLIFTPIPLVVALITRTVMDCKKGKKEETDNGAKAEENGVERNERINQYLDGAEKKIDEAKPMVSSNETAKRGIVSTDL